MPKTRSSRKRKKTLTTGTTNNNNSTNTNDTTTKKNKSTYRNQKRNVIERDDSADLDLHFTQSTLSTTPPSSSTFHSSTTSTSKTVHTLLSSFPSLQTNQPIKKATSLNDLNSWPFTAIVRQAKLTLKNIRRSYERSKSSIAKLTTHKQNGTFPSFINFQINLNFPKLEFVTSHIVEIQKILNQAKSSILDNLIIVNQKIKTHHETQLTINNIIAMALRNLNLQHVWKIYDKESYTDQIKQILILYESNLNISTTLKNKVIEKRKTQRAARKLQIQQEVDTTNDINSIINRCIETKLNRLNININNNNKNLNRYRGQTLKHRREKQTNRTRNKNNNNNNNNNNQGKAKHQRNAKKRQKQRTNNSHKAKYGRNSNNKSGSNRGSLSNRGQNSNNGHRLNRRRGANRGRGTNYEHRFNHGYNSNYGRKQFHSSNLYSSKSNRRQIHRKN